MTAPATVNSIKSKFMPLGSWEGATFSKNYESGDLPLTTHVIDVAERGVSVSITLIIYKVSDMYFLHITGKFIL